MGRKSRPVFIDSRRQRAKGKGHTADCFGQKHLHPLPDSVSFMTYAAQVGRLDEVDNLRILENIRKSQFADGEKCGLIKWYIEDREHTDENTPLFICVGLIPLKKYFSKELGGKCCLLIDEILSGALHYFIKKCKGWTCYYPNSCLGDIVFAWLLNEIFGNDDNDLFLLEILNGSGKYWTEEGWGWGEHMSDIYSKVCCYEISILLLMSEQLPEDTRKLYMGALAQLLEIEDVYGGKPRGLS